MSAPLSWLGRLCLLATVTCVTAEGAYLPSVGPPPLRFALPPVTATPSTPLPPFVITSGAVSGLPSTSAPPAQVMSATAGETPGVPTPRTGDEQSARAGATAGLGPLAEAGDWTTPLPSTTTNLAEVIESMPVTPGQWAGAVSDGGLVTPQMFLKYFTVRPGTNSTGVSLIAPVQFVPPQPPAPPSSSATFQTTPPGKP